MPNGNKLTKSDLQAIGEIVDQRLDKKLDQKLDEKLKPLKKDIKEIKKQVKKNSQDISVVISHFDDRITSNTKRVGRVEDHLRLPPTTS